MSVTWVIEAQESPTYKPYFLCRLSKGGCQFVWSDEFKDSKKFRSAQSAALWAGEHRLYCGFRICEHRNKNAASRSI